MCLNIVVEEVFKDPIELNNVTDAYSNHTPEFQVVLRSYMLHKSYSCDNTETGLNWITVALLLKKAEYQLSLFSQNANSSDVKLSEVCFGAALFLEA